MLESLKHLHIPGGGFGLGKNLDKALTLLTFPYGLSCPTSPTVITCPRRYRIYRQT